MSQFPRWAREQQMRHKLGLDKPEAGYLDVSTVSAMNKAIREKLDEQDRDFERRQRQLTDKYKAQL